MCVLRGGHGDNGTGQLCCGAAWGCMGRSGTLAVMSHTSTCMCSWFTYLSIRSTTSRLVRDSAAPAGLEKDRRRTQCRFCEYWPFQGMPAGGHATACWGTCSSARRSRPCLTLTFGSRRRACAFSFRMRLSRPRDEGCGALMAQDDLGSESGTWFARAGLRRLGPETRALADVARGSAWHPSPPDLMARLPER